MDVSLQGTDGLSPSTCSSLNKRCQPTEVGGVTYTITSGGCDPESATCSIRADIPVHFPGNHLNYPDAIGGAYATIELRLPGASGAIATCGAPFSPITDDEVTAKVKRSANCSSLSGAYDLVTIACNALSGCKKVASLPLDFYVGAGCRRPPSFSCGEGDSGSAGTCCLGGGPGGGPGGASGPGGQGAGGPGRALEGSAPPRLGPIGAAFTLPDSGPRGFELRYFYGGAGQPGWPANASYARPLGLYWNHLASTRIVEDPDESHVWLVTASGSFREYFDLGLDGFYESRIPADEYRKLEWLGAGMGWVLHGLDGSAVHYRPDGRWEKDVDRTGHETSGTYDGATGRLTSVAFADGRSLAISYLASGLISSYVETGFGGSPTRTWTFDWTLGSGSDVNHHLQSLARPDGRSWRFSYDTAAVPHITKVRLDAAGGSPSRIEKAYEYSSNGDLYRMWRGAEAFTDSAAIEKLEWTFLFDGETEVKDSYDNVTTSEFERDVDSGKPRVLSIAGDCPSCGVGPNSTIEYDNPSNPGHPLLPWKITSGEGVTTELVYDDFGRTVERTEALGTGLERSTTWTYDPDYPAYWTSRSHESAVPGCAVDRATTRTYDAANGNLLTETVSGCEVVDGVVETFGYQTDFDYTGTTGGSPTSVDPPDYSTSDVTTFDFDSARGDQLLSNRVDALVGTTSFTYDGVGRRTTVTDANGVVTTTTYSALDKVTSVTREGPTDPEDLKTQSFYTALADLFCVKLPAGNGIQYNVSTATGRVTSIERGTAVASPSSTSCLEQAEARERSVFTYDAYGQRTSETREKWISGSTWEKQFETTYLFTSKCHLDKVAQAPGTAQEAVTEYAFDCNGNLEKVWDGNHLSSGQTNPASTVYGYDALDRMTSMTQPWGGAGGGSVTTSYEFDVQDHLIEVTDGEANVTAYAYSDRDFLTRQDSEASGTTTYSYNEHGELIEETDARAVTIARTVDAADRVTAVDYPGTELDVGYSYGTTATSFDKGRLIGVTRAGETVTSTYDRFGRRLQDGDLVSAYDKNGNRTSLVHPGLLTATWTYDKLDRQTNLSIVQGVNPSQTIVSTATYKALGPLASLTFATSPTSRDETRLFDLRYQPLEIAVSGSLLTWAYTVDDAGNPTAIGQTLPANSSRTFGYQDFQYFLTSASGPWPGPLSWAYDRAGNRTMETRDTTTEAYCYVSNGTGNSPILDKVASGTCAGGTIRDYTFGAAGHLEDVTAGGNVVDFDFDEAGQLEFTERLSDDENAVFVYDGRGFLRDVLATSDAAAASAAEAASGTRAADGARLAFGARSSEALSLGEAFLSPLGGSAIFSDDFESGDLCEWDSGEPSCPAPTVRMLAATYSSDGRLHAVTESLTSDPAWVLYFAGRPVAIARPVDGAAPSVTFLTTDHLGAPILAMNAAGASIWHGGFEPFGKDFKTPSAESLGIFLRLPGQWDEPIWEEATLGAEVFYNVHRWYAPESGSYRSADPLESNSSSVLRGFLVTAPFGYSSNRALSMADPLGLFPTTKDVLNCVGNPIECEAVLFCRDLSVKETKAQFGHNEDGGPANAYQHCFWSCCMAKQIGSDAAERWGTGHEQYSGNLTCLALMDLANNSAGRGNGSSGPASGCREHCFSTPLVEEQIGECCEMGR